MLTLIAGKTPLLFFSVEDITLPKTLLLASTSLFLPTALYYALLFLYNLSPLHPLHKFPGPLFARTTPLWSLISQFRGTYPGDLLAAHEEYGPVIRVAPNVLFFSDASAWKDIFGHKLSGQPEFAKDKNFLSGVSNTETILTADREYHGYVRKLMSNGFSDRALRKQEPVIQGFVDLMMKRLGERSSGKKGEGEGEGGEEVVVDIASWYNFFTFDLISFLTFGESLQCLENSGYHTWIKLFFGMTKRAAFYQLCSGLPKLIRYPAIMLLTPKQAIRDLVTLRELTSERVEYRLKTETMDSDFMTKLIDVYPDKMDLKQLKGNSNILMAAGTETTATLMAGLTYLLLTHPHKLSKLQSEIRHNFSHPSEITIAATASSSSSFCSSYLNACIEEALRLYPPLVRPTDRIVPPGGSFINGEFIPGDTAVNVSIYVASRSPRNFPNRPEMFIPERWWRWRLNDKEEEEEEEERREASQPFSFGPRNCLGKNLAYAEIRLVIARLVWGFDVELVEQKGRGKKDWLDQKSYLAWEKGPLLVKLRVRSNNGGGEWMNE